MNQNLRFFKKRLQISQKKWNTVQEGSVRTVNSILSVISRISLARKPDTFSETILRKFPDIPERLLYNLTEIINQCVNDLVSHIKRFTEILDEMKKIEHEFQRDFLSMARKYVLSHENFVARDLEILEQAQTTIQEIIDMYETELALRIQIVNEMKDAYKFQPRKLTTNLILWASEVYIEPLKFRDLIEEFSLVERLCERFQAEFV
ncbi:MAG: hypothetical protein ACTSW1_04085 [Candidatus Hodarchaeales archaeon]